MTGESKVFFGRKLQPVVWGDLEADLWAFVQRRPGFKKLRLMVKLKSMTANKKKRHFNFKVPEGVLPYKAEFIQLRCGTTVTVTFQGSRLG